jgi:hypothetical protein
MQIAKLFCAAQWWAIKGIWRIRQFLARRRLARAGREEMEKIKAFPRIAYRRPHGLTSELVVTLTSYPARFATLAATINNLLDQEISPDRTVLWLDYRDVASLPEDVRALERHGLGIRGCHSLRSYTKLMPALSQWPNATFVTADDDVYCPTDWLVGLVERHRADTNRGVA